MLFKGLTHDSLKNGFVVDIGEAQLASYFISGLGLLRLFPRGAFRPYLLGWVFDDDLRLSEIVHCLLKI